MGSLLSILGSTVGKDILSWLVKRIFKTEQETGAGQGTFKFQAVYEAVLPLLDKLAAEGKLGKVDQTEVRAIIECIVQVLNGLGLLKGEATAAPSAIPAGTILRVQVLP